MQGRIVAHHFGPYLALANQQIYQLHFPKSDKNILKPTVGDLVIFDEASKQIQQILPRKNYIARPQIANLDLLFIVSSLVEPKYSLLLNLKFLTFALFYELRPVLMITKGDIHPLENNILHHIDYLKTAGIETIFFDKLQQQGLSRVIATLQHRIVAFAGQTGVGKSSIINAISPTFQRSIGSYSEALGRGRHQTKEVILVPYKDGFIADTPGFSSLELPMTALELAIYFPGFKSRLGQCKFANCLHQQETQCRVKDDVYHGKIPLDVYEVYLDLLMHLSGRNHR